MNFVTQVCIGLVALTALSTRASEQQMQLEYAVPRLLIELPETPPVTFWERFEFAFQERAERVFTDRFHSLNTMSWQLAQAGLSADEFREHTTHVASRTFTRSIVTGFREATFDLPFVDWLEGRRSFLGELVRQSLETVDEGAIAPLNPGYRVLERSWWQRLATSRDFYYGLRPFRTSPYAFVSAGLRNGDRLLVLAHVRYHYRNFADHQFEMALSVPLSRSFSIDLGTAYQFGRHDDSKRMVLKLAKQFDNGGIVHIGMEAQEHPKFLVGIALPL